MADFYLHRTPRPDATLGRLSLETYPLYHTLEPPNLGNRPDVSCIPCGRYPLVLSWSNRFGRELPEVRDVPGRTGIRLHRGSWVEDTLGCILSGLTVLDNHGQPGVGGSKLAELQLVGILRAALNIGPCWLRIMED